MRSDAERACAPTLSAHDCRSERPLSVNITRLLPHLAGKSLAFVGDSVDTSLYGVLIWQTAATRISDDEVRQRYARPGTVQRWESVRFPTGSRFNRAPQRELSLIHI